MITNEYLWNIAASHDWNRCSVCWGFIWKGEEHWIGSAIDGSGYTAHVHSTCYEGDYMSESRCTENSHLFKVPNLYLLDGGEATVTCECEQTQRTYKAQPLMLEERPKMRGATTHAHTKVITNDKGETTR